MLKIFFCCVFVILNILKQVSGDLKFWPSRLTENGYKIIYVIELIIYIIYLYKNKQNIAPGFIIFVILKCENTASLPVKSNS